MITPTKHSFIHFLIQGLFKGAHFAPLFPYPPHTSKSTILTIFIHDLSHFYYAQDSFPRNRVGASTTLSLYLRPDSFSSPLQAGLLYPHIFFLFSTTRFFTSSQCRTFLSITTSIYTKWFESSSHSIYVNITTRLSFLFNNHYFYQHWTCTFTTLFNIHSPFAK